MLRSKTPFFLDRTRLIAAALSLFLVIRMFYVFPSGTAQPGDIFLVAIALFLLPSAMRTSLAHKNHALVALIIWVVLVNVAWFSITDTKGFLWSAAFFGFNFLVFIVFASVYESHTEHLRSFLRFAIFTALVIQLLVLIGPVGGLRAVGTFNNPNQLGYWSVLLLAIYGVIMHDRRLSWFDFAVVGLALYICILSVGQAALGTGVLLLAVILVLHPATIHVRPIFAGLGLALFLFLALDGQLTKYISKMEAVSAVEYRYTRTMKREKSELEVRGYDRIWRHPEYLVAGAGDGAHYRFYDYEAFELHSSLGSMLFSYGIIGLFLFFAVLYQSLRSTPLLVKLYVAPVMIYGLTHQGLRFSWFWILLGIAAAIGSIYRAEARKRHVARLAEWGRAGYVSGP